MKDAVIICTRDRSDDLARCLDTISKQTRIPDEVMVVDSSSDSLSESVCEEVRRSGFIDRLIYLRCAPGLSKQRNFGISRTSAEIVHFIDDDVLLERQYFDQILMTFLANGNSEIGGVGGLITNLPEHRPNWWRRLLLLDSFQQGVILPSGMNLLTYHTDALLDVDWLNGCSMSFRRQVFRTEQFDESLSGPVKTLGDDVGLTYRVRQHWRLVVNPNAPLLHLTSEVNRADPYESAKYELIHRYQRVRSGVGNQRVMFFWISAWGQFFILLTKSLLRRSRSSARVAAATLAGIGAILVGRWRTL